MSIHIIIIRDNLPVKFTVLFADCPSIDTNNGRSIPLPPAAVHTIVLCWTESILHACEFTVTWTTEGSSPKLFPKNKYEIFDIAFVC